MSQPSDTENARRGQNEMTSRDRILAAIDWHDVDYVPCSFMIFHALRDRCADLTEFYQRQQEMGLDPVVSLADWTGKLPGSEVELPGLPVEMADEVEVSHWREQPPDSRYELLCKQIKTPDGVLTAKISLTPDWRDVGKVPLFDDYLAPRSRKFLIEEQQDLAALRYVLRAPGSATKAQFSKIAAEAKAFADQQGLPLSGGLGVGLEAGVWLCGLDRLMWGAIDEPAFVEELVELLHEWNISRMEVMLDAGMDLFVRRGWYEGTTFWSPEQFRRFVLPYLKKEAQLAHEAGVRFGYIITAGTMPVLDMIMEAEVDVIIGVDPVQDVHCDLQQMRHKTQGRLCLWGGVNGFITVETGTQQQVREEVREAMRLLGPRGFILSPVDNVLESSEISWRNVEALIDEWRQTR